MTTPGEVRMDTGEDVRMDTPDDTQTDTQNDTKMDTPDDTPSIHLIITHHNKPLPLTFPPTATITTLSTHIATTLSIPASNQKFLIPKLGLLKPPFKDPSLPLSSLANKKITLMGSTAAEVSALNTSITRASAPRTYGAVKPAIPSRTRDWKREADDARYTFHTLRPLDYLPRPERSLSFLERLRDDAGIRAAMRSHKFSVPLLTEMDPAMHTTHESRTLGLNRNKGEVIELRLRTDAGDGYRDYKTIRKTLCHELAHCVWGEHDGRFWKLCGEIEKEVERGDWRGGGRTVGREEYAEGPGGRDEEVYDHGGWEGGEYVLGGGKERGGGNAETVMSSAGGTVQMGGLSRREILARAAEERMKKVERAEKGAGGEGKGEAQ